MSGGGEFLPLAVRAYAHPTRPEDAQPSPAARPRPGRRRGPEPARRPPAVLVLDCETTTDTTQALSFGVYRYYRAEWGPVGPELSCVEEGLFHAHGLADDDPAGFACLGAYAAARPAAVDPFVEDATAALRLLSRAEFCERVFWPALSAQATVVGFNLPFDLSRLAFAWSQARSRRFAGGFSLSLFSWRGAGGVERENRFRPRLLIRPLDSKRTRIAPGRVRPGADPDTEVRAGGGFLDLRTLAYALSGSGHSLESACAAFGVAYRKREVTHGRIDPGYVDYCRADVAATAALYAALAGEYERWRLQLAPTRAYSPASLAKAQLREAGVRPLLERQPGFPAEALGRAMVAYYGGRAECRIRRAPVPVVYLDFASMYPTVCALLRLARFLRAGRIELVDDDPAPLERRLARLTLDGCFDPTLWPTLCGFALVEADGDVLPVRARYREGGGFGIGVNPLTSAEPLWYALPDLAAATLLSGRPPRVRRVVSLRSAGRAAGVRPLRVRGSRLFDPAREDLFRALVEERRRLEQSADPESRRTAAALKVVANAASYGIFVELNRQEPTVERVSLTVHGLERFEARVSTSEEPGAYFFPPLAALVTAAARLMLTLLERLVTEAGGVYAFCDTDSMAIAASRSGGPVPCPGGADRDRRGRACVRALSWTEAERIVGRFAALNPYDPALVPGSILELEHENFHPKTGRRRQLHCYAISAKRYCLYTLDRRGEPELVKWSEHALGGFYLNPTDPDQAGRDWVRETWEWIVRSDALGQTTPEPDWLDRPALTRFSATHPRLLRPFTAANDGQPYAQQVKPFNFLLVAHAAAGGHPAGLDPKRCALVAPYQPDPRGWLQLPWRNVYDPHGPTYTLSNNTLISLRGRPLPAGTIGVKSYRDVIAAYRLQPEAKSRGPDGRTCTRNTAGLLQRRPVQALTVTHIGKEANLLDEIQADLIGEQSEALVEYPDARRDPWHHLVLPALRRLPQQQTAAAAGIHRDTLADLCAGRTHPHPQTRLRLTELAAAHARDIFTSGGARPPRSDLECIARFLETAG